MLSLYSALLQCFMFNVLFSDGLCRPSHRGCNGESWNGQLHMTSPESQFVTMPTIGSGFDMSNWPVYQSYPTIYLVQIMVMLVI